MIEREPRSIAITGASSGIGYALALEYAAPGATLALFGRNAARLDDVAARARTRGATANLFPCDVSDAAAMAAALTAAHQLAPLELVIANAGVSSGTLPGGDSESPEAATLVMATNILGTLNTVQPARMLGVRQLAVMGSLAGRVALPSAPSYSASKAAIETYGLALRAALAKDGVRVSVISPGYVTSPMSARVRGPRPFEIPAERAARIIRRGLMRDAARISFPWQMAALASFAAALPFWLRRPALKLFAIRVKPN